MYRNIIYISLIIISFFVIPLQGFAKETTKDFTVVIDAGHGGKDVGATDNGVMEKNINLAVAKQLQSLIKKKMKDAKVVMTREKDDYITLQERADIANNSKGNLFISIHTNSVDKKNKNRKNISGSSVYALGLHKDENNMLVAQRENSVIELENNYEQKYSGFDPLKDESYIIFEMAQKKNLSQSIRFAEDVEKELVASGRNDRGVHQAGFWVLWATSMPSVLIELDFICNPESAKYLSSDKGARELAESIFKALERYHKNWEKENKLVLSEESKAEEDSPVQKIDSENEYEEIVNFASVSSRKNRTVTTAVTDKNNKKQFIRKRRSKEAKEKAAEANYEINSVFIAGLNEKTFEIKETEEDNDIPQIKNDKNAKSTKKTKGKENKSKKDSKSKNKRDDKKYNAKRDKMVTVYKIQILASADLLKQNNPRFCGLTPISTYKENDMYKYYYGESANREEMEVLLEDVRKRIPDAFIVSTTKSSKNTKL